MSNKLTFEDYGKEATAYFMNTEESERRLAIFVMGLCGEAGEVAEKFKKMLRDADGEITEEFKTEVTKELGDVLWYINAISHSLGLSLEDTALSNIEKMRSRKARGVQGGSGDNR